jgi:murein DD-endopeptidase MepM/ murein hydrolase activator NlpD
MNIPSFNQPEVSGKVSWFGGRNDPTDSGHTASGGTTREPGIAIYNKATLGGYWRVTAPNGRTAILRQTDLGPAPFTGRKVDVTYSALGQLGYNEHNFPTDSQVKATYLGKNKPASQTEVQTQQTQATRGGAIEGLGFNKQGYQEAAQHAAGERAAASLFTGGGEGDSILRQALQKAGTPPNAASFGTPQYTSTNIAKTPTGSFYTPAAPEGQYVHPLPSATIGRTDMGVDMSAKPGTPIRAIGDSKVLEIQPNWYSGQPYVSLELQSGPQKGKIYYVAEQIAPSVKAGQFVRGGHAIGHVAGQGTGLELGWGAPGGRTRAQATGNTGDASHGNSPAGQEFAAFLKGLR